MDHSSAHHDRCTGEHEGRCLARDGAPLHYPHEYRARLGRSAHPLMRYDDTRGTLVDLDAVPGLVERIETARSWSSSASGAVAQLSLQIACAMVDHLDDDNDAIEFVVYRVCGTREATAYRTTLLHAKAGLRREAEREVFMRYGTTEPDVLDGADDFAFACA